MTRPPRSKMQALCLGAACILFIAGVVSLAVRPARTPSIGLSYPASVQHYPADNWTMYHLNHLGTAADPTPIQYTNPVMAWRSSRLSGELYGSPLTYEGIVYVATETNQVYALSAHTGSIIWETGVAAPVSSDLLPCGNITPHLGITSTPVIDTANHTIYVDADTYTGTTASYMLYGLDLKTGRIDSTRNASPPGQKGTDILQRAALSITDGHVIAGYGGHYGDCGAYHGYVLGIPTGAVNTPNLVFMVDGIAPGQSQGAVWMGGASPVIDDHGDIWVSTGNGSVTGSRGVYDDSDSVVELSPSLKILRSYNPKTWRYDNANDLDLGSSPPVLLPYHLLFQVGKRPSVYLGSTNSNQKRQPLPTNGRSVCKSDTSGGSATLQDTVYSPCGSGVVAYLVDRYGKTPTYTISWRAPRGVSGPPILAGGRLWSISQTGYLYSLDPGTGTVESRVPIGHIANHFPSPSMGDGLILAPSAHHVVAIGQSIL